MLSEPLVRVSKACCSLVGGWRASLGLICQTLRQSTVLGVVKHKVKVFGNR